MTIQMTRKEYEMKYGTAPVQSAPVKMTRAEYEAKYNPKPFRFDVSETPAERQIRINQYKQEAEQSQKEAERANSPLGFASNFGKAVGSTLASSEIGLGKSLQKIFGNQSGKYAENINTLTDSQVNTLKLIRERKAKGIDTRILEKSYNENANLLDKMKADLNEESKIPTTGQVAGQLGGTALDVLTAGTYGKATQGLKTARLRGKIPFVKRATAIIPELGQLATQKAGGLFTAKGALNVAKGGGIGYASDVTLGLQGLRGEDRTGFKSAIPGLGTAIGTGIPVISEGFQSIKNVRDPEIRANKIINQRKTELDKLDKLQTLKKTTEKGRQRGIDVKQVLAETDVLHGAVDKNGTITTKGKGGATEQYFNQFIKGNEDMVNEVLKKEGRSIAPQVVQKKLEQAIMDAGIEGKALTQAKNSIADELAGYSLRANENGSVPLNTLHSAKVDKYNNINFFTESNTKKYDKTVAKALKELVEENTKSVSVKEINKELSKHFAVIDYLEKLDGRKVEGGRLGKYFAQTVGAIVGSHFGPLGTIAGAEAGGRIKGGMMSRAFSGETGKVFPQAKSIQEASEYIKSKPLEIPQSSNILGNRQISQTTTIIPTINGISDNIPQKKGIIKGFPKSKK